MKTLLKPVAILLPGLLGIVVVIAVFPRILEYFRLKSDPPPAAPAGSLLPRGRLVSLRTNQDMYEDVMKGKVLLLFVTTDCNACAKELSNAVQSAPLLTPKVTIYTVAVEERNSVIMFMKANRVDLPVLLDPGAVILARLGFKYMPTKVLLHDGVITKIWYGSSRDKDVLIKDVQE